MSTNSALWKRQRDDIDLNCGTILAGEENVDEVGARIFQLMLAVASGAATKSELHGYGQDEFVPWPFGAIT